MNDGMYVCMYVCVYIRCQLAQAFARQNLWCQSKVWLGIVGLVRCNGRGKDV